jgi:outer membrane protein TolC
VSIRYVFIYFLITCALFAQEKKIIVAFEDLPRLLEQTSPHQKIINNQRAIIEAQSNTILHWSNPELNYDHEQVESGGISEKEELLYLSKSFSMPWNYLQERSILKEESNAADFVRKQNTNQLLSNTRTEYVRLSQLNKLKEKQSDLISILDDLNQTVKARRDEGALSGIEATLLSMSMFGLQTDMIQTQKAYRLSTNTLKQFLGINSDTEVNLISTIDFQQIQSESIQNKDLTENHPGFQARRARMAATDRRITLEKSKILPSFSLQVGFKRINPGWEGYTLGLSIPLPLLNWNSSQIEVQKIKHRIQSAEVDLYRRKLQSTVDNLIKSIHSDITLLQKNQIYLYDSKIVEDLLAAYREGVLTLSEFLNAVQIYHDGYRQYTEQFITYYEAVFEMEILTDQQLVKF